MTFKILVVKADERDLEDTCTMLQAISDEHDDPAPRAALTPFLEVHRARNGEDAWEMAMATDYDVAFVDTELPGISGFQFSWCYTEHLMDTNADGWKEGFPARGVPRIDTPPLPTTPPRQRQCIMIACAADMTAVEDLQNFRVYDLLRSPVTAPALRRMLHKWLPSPAQSVDRESLLDAAAAAARSPKRCKSSVLRSARVLQVEDCPISGLAVEALFQQLGFWIDTVPDGESAMEKLSTRRYALVLLDIDLPVMSGYALASWYKDYCRREKVQRAYVMALTADPHVEQCREFGMDWCYPKPLTFALVEVLARQWLAGIGPSPTPSPVLLPKASDLPSSAHSLPPMLPPPHTASGQGGQEAGGARQPGALSTGVLPYSPTRAAPVASQATPPRAARGASQSQLTPRMAAMDVSEAAAPAAMDEGRDGA